MAHAERFGSADRLHNPGQFRLCYRQGRKRHGRLATLHAHPNQEQRARLGITASRKVGKAVIRHRLKRWARECFRRWPSRAELAGLDVVVHLKPAAADADFAAFAGEIDRQLAALIQMPGARRP